MFIRTESFGSFLRLYPIISILIAIHLILWFYCSFIPSGKELLSLSIGFNYAVTQGEYWRLVTSNFFHASFGHALFNSFSLVLFGPHLERLLGKFLFIISYLGAGVMGGVGTLLLSPPQFFHLGASNAILGLFGIYIYMIMNRKDLIDRTNSQIVIVILIIGSVMSVMNTNVNLIGHLFGFLGGAVLAPLILRKK